jgi:potassium efflux system protein
VSDPVLKLRTRRLPPGLRACWIAWVGAMLLFAGLVHAETITLDPDLANWLAGHGPVKVAPDPDLAPIDFIDGGGRHRGLSADLTAMLAARTGMRVQILPKDRFDTVLTALEAGELDVASSVFKSPARNARFLFSTPYLRLPGALIARRGGPATSELDDLRGRRIAVVEGHVWQELLAGVGYIDEQRAFASIGEALSAVAGGEADAYVGDLLSADYAMQRAKLTEALVVSGETRLEAELAYAVRRDLPQLKAVLDGALASITVEEEQQLRARWESVEAIAESNVEIEIPDSVALAVADLRRKLEARTDLDETERNTLAERLDAAARFDAAASESIVRIERIRQEAAQAAVDGASVAATASPAEGLLRWRGSLPQRATLEQLERLLAVEQSARDSLRESAERSQQQIQELQQRPTELRREIIDLRARLDQFKVADESADLATQIERLVNLAELRSLRAALAAASTEQAHADSLLRAAEVRRRERQRLLAQGAERVAILEQLVAERGDSQLREELDALRKMAASKADAVPPIRDLAAENVATGEALAQGTRQLARLREQASEIEANAAEVARALQNTKARIAIGGVTEAVGMVLMVERRRLPYTQVRRALLAELQREMADARLLQITVSEEIERLRDLGSVLARLTKDDELDLAALPEARAVLTELLLVRGELLPRQLQLQQRTLEVLQQSEATLIKLIADGQALTLLMDQNLLWIPSHSVANADWAPRLGDAWRDLVRAQRWNPSLAKLGKGLLESPLWILALLLPVALVALRPRLAGALVERAVRVRNLREDELRHTLEALGLTALIALPGPLLLGLVAQMLQSVGKPVDFTHKLGVAIQVVAPYAYFFALIAVFCREDGVARAHFRWVKARCEALLRIRPYLQLLVVPLVFLMVLSLLRGGDNANGALLRLAVILVALILAALIGWLLAPGRLMASRVAGSDPRPQSRRLLRIGAIGALIGMALLALMGYVLTVATLIRVVLDTLEVLFGVALIYGLALRWLVIGERRVALAQPSQPPVATHGNAGMEVPAVSIDSINLRTISEQSRKLLRALTVVTLAMGLLWSLAAVAPAFSMLDKVVLWETQTLVDGEAQADFISLGDVLLAMVALLIGTVAARNIPGLLEIVLLKTFARDASVRYAAVAVTRYLIVIAMVFASVGLLGIRWNDLQWLAAAVSVGLGFGLQEIFANFVAGLILLFERPFRVGDVVSINELSGTVRRVQTRATTIVDWDGKDIIIPNKALITERFVNWTLSDTVTRIVIKVGVSYDSDPAQVRSELLDLARAHPAVLYDPAPVALFLLLGGSTLDFELRCFVREIGDRLRTIDDLNGRIIRRFRECGIAIAYPQMDVHLHRPPLEATPEAAAVVAATAG